MFINSIIPAPNAKKAVWYDPIKDDIVITTSDIIGLIELLNPENPEETATIPMYMTADKLGVYTLPQLDVNFLEFLDPFDSVDLGKYTQQIQDIKILYAKMQAENPEVVEVETKGNVSQIKRIIRNIKSESPKHEN